MHRKIVQHIFNKRYSRISTTTRNYFESPKQKTTSTVDSGEILHFKQYVDTWWYELGPFRPLHSMNHLRTAFIKDGLKHRGKLHPELIHSSTPLKHLQVLDVGCGGGILTESLARLGAHVTGIDPCEDLVNCAKVHANYDASVKENINYIIGCIEDYTEKHKNKYDCVVASECLEHITLKDIFLKSCVDVLKPGGSLFLTTMNKTTMAWFGGIICAEYIFQFIPKETHDWQKFISPEDVEKMLNKYNCDTHLVHGMMYNFITNSWFWISDTSISYAMHVVKNDVIDKANKL